MSRYSLEEIEGRENAGRRRLREERGREREREREREEEGGAIGKEREEY